MIGFTASFFVDILSIILIRRLVLQRGADTGQIQSVRAQKTIDFAVSMW